MLRRGLHVSKILKQSERFFSSTSAVEYPKQTVVRHAMNAAIKPVGASSEVNQFAVINLAGTQYKVTKGDVLFAEKIIDAKVGEILSLDQVLLLGSKEETVVGRPFVDGAKVHARVEEQTFDEKVIVFKMKRRKNYRRKQGHRRPVTVLRVTDISSS